MDRQLIVSEYRDILILHAAFAALCIAVLMIPLGISLGVRLFVLVFIYNLAVPGIGTLLGHEDWVDLQLFLLPLGFFILIAESLFCNQLGILQYPEDGFLKIGSVSAYMALMWVIPLFIIVFIGQQVKIHYSQMTSLTAVAALSLLIFGVSEQIMWVLPVGVWNVKRIWYFLLPEMFLSISTYACYGVVQYKSILTKMSLAFVTMLFYFSNVVFFYFLVEKVAGF